tara:strand:- start:24355 stop:24993 length:639 start_codon:yes stop_codon:yes gene_type:complete
LSRINHFELIETLLENEKVSVLPENFWKNRMTRYFYLIKNIKEFINIEELPSSFYFDFDNLVELLNTNKINEDMSLFFDLDGVKNKNGKIKGSDRSKEQFECVINLYLSLLNIDLNKTSKKEIQQVGDTNMSLILLENSLIFIKNGFEVEIEYKKSLKEDKSLKRKQLLDLIFKEYTDKNKIMNSLIVFNEVFEKTQKEEDFKELLELNIVN